MPMHRFLQTEKRLPYKYTETDRLNSHEDSHAYNATIACNYKFRKKEVLFWFSNLKSVFELSNLKSHMRTLNKDLVLEAK